MFSNFAQGEQVATYLRVIRRRWWLAVLLALLSAGITYAGTTLLLPTEYTASVELQVIPPTTAYGFSTAGDANTYAVLMTSAPVEAAAIKNARPAARRDPGALARAYCVASSTDIFVVCSTTSHYPRAASAALNDLASAFLAYNATAQRSQYGPSLSTLTRQEAQLRQEIAGFRLSLSKLQTNSTPDANTEFQINSLQNQITLDQGSLSQLAVQESNIRQQILSAQSSVHVINPAGGPLVPISPHPLRNAVLGLILGLGLALALILLLEFLDDRLHASEEIGGVLGASVLGAIRQFDTPSQSVSFVALTAPHSIVAEAYRVFRTNLDFVDVDQRNKILLMSSAREHEGKTTTATNLAASIAMSGRSVLLVDVDLRRAGITKRLGLRSRRGLSSALLSDDLPSNAIETEVPGLHVVPSGPLPPNAAQLLESGHMRTWLTRVSEEYDVVILDAPPILSLADARMLAPLTDGVILVVDPQLTGRRWLKQTAQAIAAVRCRIIGVVINRDPFIDAQHYNSYYYYEGQDQAGDEGRRSGPAEVIAAAAKSGSG